MKKVVVFLIIIYCQAVVSKNINYVFDIDYITINKAGSDIEALAIGGQIPAPKIEANVGDVLSVTFNNKLDEETSIHWHGVLLPNEQDGVPYLTTNPIKPNTSHTYTFPIIHSGTYWYHSHSGLQEQRGLYGPLVFHDNKSEPNLADKDEVIVFSDWSDERPEQIHSNLKKEDDYYALKKGSVQSWDKVICHGKESIKNRVKHAWTRMGPMDISDVGYDAFLANGKKEQYIDASPGQRIRLRLINSSASTYFNVRFAGGPISIVAADGVKVVPVNRNEILMAIAETYDIIVKVPEVGSYELRATSEDGAGFASVFIGAGVKRSVSPYIPPNLFLSKHGNMSGHAYHSNNMITNGYDYLESPVNTSFSPKIQLREIELNLTGFMDGYVWSFNNKPFSESDKILIKRGEVVRFILKNKTMMHHPIHLHGHFFRVINNRGNYSPLKHTVNVPAMGQQIIEFYANEEKDWFFHCHNLYHMKSGMSRVISYGKDSKLGTFLSQNLAKDNAWLPRLEVEFLSHMAVGEGKVFNNHNSFVLEYDYDWDKSYDIEAFYKRLLTRFFGAFVGANFERESADDEAANKFIVGFSYTLPLLVDSQLRLDSEGKIRLQLQSDLQIFERVNFDWLINTDEEFNVGLTYAATKKAMFRASYDSEYGFGVGVKFLF